MNVPCIHADGLALMLGGVRVLDDISFRLETGQSLGIIGRSGSGKTMLLRMLTGLERPAQGRLSIWGKESKVLTERHWYALRRRIGLVLEDCPLLHDLNLAENLALPLFAAGLPPDQIESRLEHCLVNFDLDSWRAARVDELSASLAKRARLARAFITEPELLLFDAPFDGLDTESAQELQDDLCRLIARQKIALLITSHDRERVERFGAEILMLEQGRLTPPHAR